MRNSEKTQYINNVIKNLKGKKLLFRNASKNCQQKAWQQQ